MQSLLGRLVTRATVDVARTIRLDAEVRARFATLAGQAAVEVRPLLLAQLLAGEQELDVHRHHEAARLALHPRIEDLLGGREEGAGRHHPAVQGERAAEQGRELGHGAVGVRGRAGGDHGEGALRASGMGRRQAQEGGRRALPPQPAGRY